MYITSKGQGHRVTKCITSRGDSHVAPSRCSCVVAQRDGPAWPSRRATTTMQNCRIQGNRVVDVSYSLYRVPTIILCGFLFGFMFYCITLHFVPP